jgi:hypothetical protein
MCRHIRLVYFLICVHPWNPWSKSARQWPNISGVSPTAPPQSPAQKGGGDQPEQRGNGQREFQRPDRRPMVKPAELECERRYGKLVVRGRFDDRSPHGLPHAVSRRARNRSRSYQNAGSTSSPRPNAWLCPATPRFDREFVMAPAKNRRRLSFLCDQTGSKTEPTLILFFPELSIPAHAARHHDGRRHVNDAPLTFEDAGIACASVDASSILVVSCRSL